MVGKTGRLAFIYASAIASLLAGASVTHAIMKPDLSIKKPDDSDSSADDKGGGESAPTKAWA